LKGDAVLVFARRPELGAVKTRLAAQLGDEFTLKLYRAFLIDTLTAARQAGGTVLLAHTRGSFFPEQELADVNFEQRGDSFGERFDNALTDAAANLSADAKIVLIGADTPHLSPHSLRNSLDALRDAKAVIGPSFNGGFYLLGFSISPVPVAVAFAQPADREVPEVVRLLCRAGVTPKIQEFWFDVDQPEDLTRLESFIALSECMESEWIPRCTRAALADLMIKPIRAVREPVLSGEPFSLLQMGAGLGSDIVQT